MAEQSLRETMGAAAEVLRATGERWAELLARLELGDEQLEAAWAEDAEILCAALRTLDEEAKRRGSPWRPPGTAGFEPGRPPLPQRSCAYRAARVRALGASGTKAKDGRSQSDLNRRIRRLSAVSRRRSMPLGAHGSSTRRRSRVATELAEDARLARHPPRRSIPNQWA